MTYMTFCAACHMTYMTFCAACHMTYMTFCDASHMTYMTLCDASHITYSTLPTGPPRFDPERTVFKNISKINPYLLQDVVDCYRKAKIVCKYCFFRNRRQEKIGLNRYCRQCKRTSPSVLVIPASKMCINFGNMTFLPILPPPKVLLANGNRHKPFQYCHNHDHMSCFEKSATGDSWFAHSIEELVIWTVQRHYG